MENAVQTDLRDRTELSDLLGDGGFEDLAEDGFGGFAFGEGFVGEADAVEHDVVCEGEEVFGDDVVAAVEECAGA